MNLSDQRTWLLKYSYLILLTILSMNGINTILFKFYHISNIQICKIYRKFVYIPKIRIGNFYEKNGGQDLISVIKKLIFDGQKIFIFFCFWHPLSWPLRQTRHIQNVLSCALNVFLMRVSIDLFKSLPFS